MTKRSPSEYQDMSREEIVSLLKEKDQVILDSHKEIMEFCEGNINVSVMISALSHHIQKDVEDFIQRYNYTPNA